MSSLYELVELPDGGVGLRRAGEDGEPLICIKFSSEAKTFLQDSRFEVVKAMIEAGMEVVGDIIDTDEVSEEDIDSSEITYH